jgi:DNA-binding NarL/FixJ family response regulator
MMEEPTSGGKIRVLVADDHALFREGVNALLAATPDIEVIGEASSGDEAVDRAEQLGPDVILMDINMPGINGIDATRTILQRSPQMGIVMITMLEDDSSVFAAMRAGARGYVLKGAHHNEMLNAIRAVAQGQALFGPGIARRMVNFFRASGERQREPSSETAFPELTEREREILELVAQGRKNPEIADRLVISPKTVRNHITNIFSKLQVADRSEAIIQARDAGLGTGKKKLDDQPHNT